LDRDVIICPKYLFIAHKKTVKDHQSGRKLIANVENRVIAAELLCIIILKSQSFIQIIHLEKEKT